MISALTSLAWVTPGAVMEHRRRMSESTHAHCTFCTTRGSMALSSALPREWDSAQAQWMSLIAGCVSWL